METQIKSYSIVDSTLREGEQFAGARFTTMDKIKIAKLLDAFGVEYIELSSPASSPISIEDHKILLDQGLKATIVPHLRCDKRDIDPHRAVVWGSNTAISCISDPGRARRAIQPSSTRRKERPQCP